MVISLQISPDFVLFSQDHWLPIIIAAALTILVIVFANQFLNSNQKRKLGFGISLIPLFCVLFRMYMEYDTGLFSVQGSLPLHLCRVIAFALPLIMLNENRKWLGVMYFWVLVGTANAIITPDEKTIFPHWSYIVYFSLHLGLVSTMLYAIFVYKFRLIWKDYFEAIRVTIGYAILVTLINILIGSNYFYTMGTPSSGSLLDKLGPWPWYILTGLVLLVILFFIVFIPYLFWNYIDRKSD